MERAPIRWREGEMIGSGCYARVYKGVNLETGELIAVKKIVICRGDEASKTKERIREIEEEIKLHKTLSHPNIVKYLGCAREEDFIAILLELCEGGSIESLLSMFGIFPEEVIRMYTKKILGGLEYLHQKGILHGDIKGENILVDNKGCIKLADFGSSRIAVTRGTTYFMAPEVICGSGYHSSADIWSLGCTVIEMATGMPPWSDKFNMFGALYHIGTTKSAPPIPDQLSAAAKDFLQKCLHVEPNYRSTSSELLQHPFITGGRESFSDPPYFSDHNACEIDIEDELLMD